MKTFAISALTVLGMTLASVGTSSAGDAEAGKATFNKCMACHAIGEGAKNKAGPELNGLDGRKAGTLEGYAYSDAMKNSGITWNQAEFEEYIKNPKAKVPGVKMVFAGIAKQSELDNLWAYVSQFDKDGKVKAK
jgi:cytochrome c